MASYAEKIAAGRLPCCVPGCQRTFKDDGSSEILCGVHWRGAPARLRRRVQKLRRLYRARFGDNAAWTYPAGSPQRLKAVQGARLFSAAWDACRDAAIQKAMGI